MTSTLNGQVESLAVGLLFAEVRHLEYICLPHGGAEYGLSLSGMPLDAVSWQKPSIALRLPLIEQLLRGVGDIGCLCDGLMDRRREIAALARHREEAGYRGQVCCMGRVRQSRRPTVPGEPGQ